MHPRHAARLAAHQAVSARLSMLSDRRIADLVATAPAHGSGIGGRSAELDVGGRRVFVKRVPLTDLETEYPRSTVNLFDLPTFYQYGLGSAGFGAWRELAAHTMTTNWVLTGIYGSFPLMYHWRVIPDSPPVGLADGRDVARHAWAERQLVQGADFMSAQGLVHFDAHFHNVLTDGRLLYFADFGLALSSRFDLSPAEAAFLADHLDYDRHYVASHLLRHHLPGLGHDDVQHESFLRGWLAGDARPVPPALAAIIDRHAGAALVLHDFHRRLMTDTKRTPYPVDELRRRSTAPRTGRSSAGRLCG